MGYCAALVGAVLTEDTLCGSWLVCRGRSVVFVLPAVSAAVVRRQQGVGPQARIASIVLAMPRICITRFKL